MTTHQDKKVQIELLVCAPNCIADSTNNIFPDYIIYIFHHSLKISRETCIKLSLGTMS